MHDPETVAFDIRWPFGGTRLKGGFVSRPHFATIWHVDPQIGGSDDSCGWAYPRMSKKQRERVDNLAWWEAREPWFRAHRGKELTDPMLLETLCRAALLRTAQAMQIPLSWERACELAVRLVHNPSDNLRGSFALLPGWHTNSQDDTEYWREECARGLFYALAATLLRDRRRWWQHPRWHLQHWKIQIHGLQSLKRWMWSRCQHCGKRFSWGYAPASSHWHGTGPRWFRSEDGVAHIECVRAHLNAAMEVPA